MGTLQGFPVPIQRAVVPGGPTGTHRPVSGISVGDTLIDVRHLSTDFVTNVSLLGEFSISSADEIDNTGPNTDTTGNFLIVTWAASA